MSSVVNAPTGRTWVYTVCYNEELIMPYFARNYAWAERIVVFDDQSSDRTREVLKPFSNVEIRSVDTGGILDDSYLSFTKNNCWKECRNCGVDFVVVVDADELIWAGDVSSWLVHWKNEGYSIVRPTGYEMISESVPRERGDLTNEINRGVKNRSYSKPCIFSPNDIVEINFTPGCHNHKAVGYVSELSTNNVKLLHYRYLSLDYHLHRIEIRRTRQCRQDILSGRGIHYRWSRARWQTEFTRVLQRSTTVI